MDSVLIVGDCEPRVRTVLGRLGYNLVDIPAKQGVPEVIRREVIDLILLDGSLDGGIVDMCEYFRADPAASGIPIVCLAGSVEECEQLAGARYPLLECLPPPHSGGGIAGRIATLLRVRKLAGGEKGSAATILEMNAALRDLTDRLARDLAEARAIQQSLLPEHLPHDPRFTLAASYDPLEEVGGDWYAARREHSGRITLQIADVSGHGLSSAFLGSMTKLAHNAAGQESPDRLLSGMNRLMAPILPNGKFITSAAASFDPQTGELLFARAGHPPGLIVRGAGGAIEELRGDGFAIGFFEESDYSLERATLAPGDALFLYTDGLTEALNRAKAQFGGARLVAAMQSIPTAAGAAEAIAHVLGDFTTFLDGRAVKDDVTILALKRTRSSFDQ